MGDNLSQMAYRQYNRCTSLTSSRYYEVRGLYNDSLSCCVNALLQSFSATSELLDVLNKWNPSDGNERSNVPMQLKNTLLSMRERSHPAPHKAFLDCLYRHTIRRYSQQDADEIFHMILNLSQKQMPDNLAKDIRSLYEIEVETQVTCSVCASVCQVPSSLFSLPLAICDGENTLENCIHSFSKRQILEDCEKFYCGPCDKKQPCGHEQKIISLPQILCVNLKRFRNDRGIIKKLSSKVTFPEALKTSIFAGASKCPLIDEHYSLFGVIVHSGSVMFGHYTAFIRPSHDQTWYHADDNSVEQATWEAVQDTYNGTRTAYLLLYRKSLDSSG